MITKLWYLLEKFVDPHPVLPGGLGPGTSSAPLGGTSVASCGSWMDLPSGPTPTTWGTTGDSATQLCNVKINRAIQSQIKRSETEMVEADQKVIRSLGTEPKAKWASLIKIPA